MLKSEELLVAGEKSSRKNLKKKRRQKKLNKKRCVCKRERSNVLINMIGH